MIRIAGLRAVSGGSGGVRNKEGRATPAFPSELKTGDVETSGSALSGATLNCDTSSDVESFEKSTSVSVDSIGVASLEGPGSDLGLVLGKNTSMAEILVDAHEARATANE